MDLLKYLAARLSEPSTWASLAAVLALTHVSVDPGLLSQITLWGASLAAAGGVLLKERGSVSTGTLVTDGLTTLTAALKGRPIASLLGLLLIMSGSACTKTPQPAATVVATESGLAVAGHAALVYLHLPICTGSNGPVCSTVAIKAEVKAAFDQAYGATTAAQAVADAGGSPDLTAATAALTALQSIEATLPKAGS